LNDIFRCVVLLYLLKVCRNYVERMLYQVEKIFVIEIADTVFDSQYPE
jgi:hypothetical protein